MSSEQAEQPAATPETAAAPSDATGGGAAATGQPAAAQRSSQVVRWITVAVAVLAVGVLVVVGGPRVVSLFTLPDCDDDVARKAVSEILAEKKLAIGPLNEVKATAASRSERVCAARADTPGAVLSLDYHIDWSGWSPRVTLTDMQAESRIEPEQLLKVKRAADDFLQRAKDSPTSGRPPRQAEPAVAAQLDTIFDITPLERAPLSAADFPKAKEWFRAGDRVGTVYILAGTGVSDIDRLPNDPNVRQRTRRNVVDFAPEFARYLDFQVKLAGIMMDAELARAAKAGDKSDGRGSDQPETGRDAAELRSTLADALTGDLTTLSYEGLSDDWRRERLAIMMQIAPKAARFLSADQRRAVQAHALKVTSYVRDNSVQDRIKGFADAISP